MGQIRKNGKTGYGRAANANDETVRLHTLERRRCRTLAEDEALRMLLAVSREGNPRGLVPLREYMSFRDRIDEA